MQMFGEKPIQRKMIDGNSTTRWASKNVDSSKPMEITLTFEEKEVLAQLVFDLLYQTIMESDHLKSKR
ncbi:MAG: hypothetical protein ACLVC1_04795 [Mediterraneibacter gnavus]